MKNLYNYIFGIIFLTTLSCNEFLDPLPKGLIVAKTVSDFRLLLDNADTRYTNNLAQNSVFVDALTDDVQVSMEELENWKEKTLHVKHLYQFDSEIWFPDGATTDVMWKNAYYISTLASNILDEIYNAEGSEEIRNQLIAEARVHRAYAYLMLVNVYAKHYSSATAASDMGVPLISNPVTLPSLERASVQEVYDFIERELLESIDDLPADVAQQVSHRPTQVATYAILARTYLYKGEYEKALEMANKSLSIRNTLYDYNEIYTGVDISDNVIGISRTNDMEMLLHKTTTKGFHLRNYMILDSASFNELYPDFNVIDTALTENYDLRRTLWFDGFDQQGRIFKPYLSYEFTDASHRYSVDADGNVDYLSIATPEMYLIRAECNARLGNGSSALEDINTIRSHRFKTGTYTAVTASDFGNNDDAILDEVLLERRRELYGKDLRLFDIKRLGLSVQHQLGDQVISLPANDAKLVWPIYYEYISLNPELEQNQR
ncbi:RagB/SusD family nutrient uptake outer membrane protein [Membranihabitans marinus]|uniref:RagB/SusD family nutrient uptake outer membrane protein n=1 Tax=Membranihabitans marinus TaxID=1227546 RepID=UPI001F442C0A|nr:RagB/SusD family nutrient uptake outer membrane protein [Membranihabitans marinus]